LAAIKIIRLYGLRFKIEHTFKQAVRLIGSFSYHFWMSDMKPRRRRGGNQHLHRASPEYRDAVRRKLHAYHVFIQAAVVCQGLLPAARLGLLRLLAAHHPAWHSALRAGRRQCPAPQHARISPEFHLRQQLRKIRHRTAGQRSDAGVPARVLSWDCAKTLDSRAITISMV
jgi:hypothetical protein